MAADEIAGVIKTTSLVELDLSHNPLSTMGIIIISRALKSLTIKYLQLLNLRNCGITTEVVDYLTDVLSTLNNLRELDISFNRCISSDGMSKLLSAL